MIRCGLYIRVSTDMQKEKGESLDVQSRRLNAYVNCKEGWSVAEVYKDAGVSAKNTNRPEFNKMIDNIKQGKLDAILCTKLDRLFRNTKDFLDITEFFEKENIKFVCLEANIDTSTATGRVFSTMRAAFAQFERETTAERVRDVMRSRAEQGKWNGGITPFGYFSEDKELKINLDEARVIRRIYDLYIEKQSLRYIVHWLNTEGIRTRKGDFWSPTSVRRMLTNPFYYGMVTYSKRSHSYSGELRRNEISICNKGLHSQIISEEIFSRAQEIIKHQTKDAPKANAKYLLTGIIYCGICGSRMHGMASHKKNTGKYYSYYKCAGHLQKGSALCVGGTTMPVASLETSITNDLKDFSINRTRLEEAVKVLGCHSSRDSGKIKERIKLLKGWLSKIQVKKQKIFELYEEESISKADLLSRKALAEEEELSINKEIDELDNKLMFVDSDSYDLDYTLGLCKDMKEVYDELDLPDRKELIRNLLCAVKVNKHYIDYSMHLRSKFISYAQDSCQSVESSDTGRGSSPLLT